jgi:hypothetical protein
MSIVMFISLMGDAKSKDSKLNGSKNFALNFFVNVKQ